MKRWDVQGYSFVTDIGQFVKHADYVQVETTLHNWIDKAGGYRCRIDQLESERDTLRAELAECAAVLPGPYYMDLPDGGDVSVSEQLKRMAKDAERYRLLRRKFAIISDGEGHAEFCAINLPRPTYIAPSSAIELDTALDRERLGLDGARPPTPTGWSDTDWIKHLQEQKEPHPLAGLHINQGSMDAAADAYEAEYNAARMLEALKAAAQFVETEQFPIGWSVDRIREVIAKVSGTTPNNDSEKKA